MRPGIRKLWRTSWSNFLELRRPVMESWSSYVTGKTSDNVVPFKAASQ